jgi:hypothetical protein
MTAPMTDADDHTRRLAAASVAYLHCCACPGPRGHAGEHAVLLAMVAAMVTRPQQYDIDLEATGSLGKVMIAP